VAELGKSTTDDVIAAYSLDTDRLILTNDDDFLREFDASAYCGLLFIEDETLTSETISDIVHALSEHIDHEQADGVLYVSTNWL
jgi:predicted nuclease of predicted toxin-antitoxin system